MVEMVSIFFYSNEIQIEFIRMILREEERSDE